jgi:hypothetical protein
MKTYSSSVSSVGPPLSAQRRDKERAGIGSRNRCCYQERAGIGSRNRRCYRQHHTIGRRHRLSLMPPAHNNRGIDKESQSPTTTVTGSLLQKPVTLAAANLGSCDKNPGKAYTTMDTGAIFEKKGGSSKWFDLRGNGAKSSRGADKGGIKPAAGKHSKNLKNRKNRKVQLDKEHLSRKKISMILTPPER